MSLISSSLLTVWEFVKRHPGAVLVLVGVGGEIILEWKTTKGPRAWLRKLCWSLLVLGLTLEFWEAADSDNQVRRLNMLQGSSGDRFLNLGVDILRANPPGEAFILFDKSAPDAKMFAESVGLFLHIAGWKELGIGPTTPDSLSNIAGGSPAGMSFLFEIAKDNDDAVILFFRNNSAKTNPGTVLERALVESNIRCLGTGTPPDWSDSRVVVWVLKRP